jgi:hypothetical protein
MNSLRISSLRVNSLRIRSLLSFLLIACGVFVGSASLACEKHLDGHQNSSESAGEAARR